MNRTRIPAITFLLASTLLTSGMAHAAPVRNVLQRAPAESMMSRAEERGALRMAQSGLPPVNLMTRARERAIRRLADNGHRAADEDVPSAIPTRPVRTRSSSSSASVRSRPAETDSSSSSSRMTVREFRADVFRMVNEEREKAGLLPYTYSGTLEQSAQEYAVVMLETECFSHSDCGSTLKERMHASGYYQGGSRSYYYGENIARGQDTAEEVMEDWLASPPHKAAILSERFAEIGIGKQGEYWVQHFGLVQ